MKSIKKTVDLGVAKTPVSSAKAISLSKIKTPLIVNLPVLNDTDVDGLEISIKVTGKQIIARVLVKGEEISQQAIPVKKIPTPPPIKKEDIIKALQQLRFNFNIRK